MVTTMIREAVPITMPSAVSRKRTLLIRKESRAMLTISLNSIVRRAVSAKGWTTMFLLYGEGARASADYWTWRTLRRQLLAHVRSVIAVSLQLQLLHEGKRVHETAVLRNRALATAPHDGLAEEAADPDQESQHI